MWPRHSHGAGHEQAGPDLPVNHHTVGPHQTSYTHRSLITLRKEAEKVAKENKMKLYLTSVKEDLNVAVIFQHLAENYVNKVLRYLLNLAKICRI